MTIETKKYGIYLGAGDVYEVWICDVEHVKLELISAHRTTDEAFAARKRYQDADLARKR